MENTNEAAGNNTQDVISTKNLDDKIDMAN